jgi:hypothetical protein
LLIEKRLKDRIIPVQEAKNIFVNTGETLAGVRAPVDTTGGIILPEL